MDIDKILITKTGEYFLNSESVTRLTKEIRAHYQKKPTEKLTVPNGNESKFEVYFSKGEGIIVTEFTKKDDKNIQGLKVTFRKDGTTRIDDVNQDTIAPAGILHTYFGVCDQEGTVTFHTKNDNQSNPSHVDHLLNSNHWHGLDTKEIANRYRDGVSIAIGVLKKIYQA